MHIYIYIYIHTHVICIVYQAGVREGPGGAARAGPPPRHAREPRGGDRGDGEAGEALHGGHFYHCYYH